jgi:hypothetical protein
MKTDQFNKSFDLDRSARSPRAMPKHALVEYPVAVTADGRPFNHSAEYFFFDGEEIRSSNGFRRFDAENLGRSGLRVIPIKKLRESRDKAIEDAQIALVKKIESLRDQVRKFEEQKTTANRTMKFILMARG